MTSSIAPRTQDSSLTSSTSPVEKSSISGFFESVKSTTIRIFKFCCSSIAQLPQLPQQIINLIKNAYNILVDGVNAKDQDGMTPLMRAVQKGDITNVNRLLRCEGIKVNATNNDNETALICASKVLEKNEGVTACIAALVENENIDLTIADNDGKTALMYLAASCDVEGTRLLTESGKNIGINKQDKLGGTALMAVATLDNSPAIDILRLLFTQKDINPKLVCKYGYTALIYCMTSRGDLECAEFLIEQSAGCINTKTKGERTALMMAADHRPHLIELLLKVPGIDPDLKNDDDMTALDIAKEQCEGVKHTTLEKDYEKAIKLLEQFQEQRGKQKTNNSGQ